MASLHVIINTISIFTPVETKPFFSWPKILNMMDTNAIIVGQEKKDFVSTGGKMLMVSMISCKLAIVPVVRAERQRCILVPIFKEDNILVLDTTTMIPELSQPTATLLKRRTSMELKC
jgi:hypothetical protein